MKIGALHIIIRNELNLKSKIVYELMVKTM